MARTESAGQTHRIVEPKTETLREEALQTRLRALEQLIRAIEDELSDSELDDEQKLQNIGERVAQFMDGR